MWWPLMSIVLICWSIPVGAWYSFRRDNLTWDSDDTVMASFFAIVGFVIYVVIVFAEAT